MNKTGRPTFTISSLPILAAAAAFGLIGDMLLLGRGSAGMNALLCSVAFAALLCGVARRLRMPISIDAGGGLALACFFAAFAAWRASSTLAFLNMAAILSIFAIAAFKFPDARFFVASVFEYPLCLFRVVISSIFGVMALFFKETDWQALPKSTWQRGAIMALRGVLIALPFLAVFGVLFASADPIFSHYAHQLFDWDIQDMLTNLFWILFWFWWAAGLLRASFIKDWPAGEAQPPQKARLSITEVATALALLNALFLAFVIVQFSFFFGGARYVQETIGMTYKDYARGGFFELVWVSLLTLPLLLAAHALVAKDSSRNRRLFGSLAGFLVLLLFVIMASAIQRMRLYIQWGGLTELRLYTSAFMVWLALCFIWFLATVLRGLRERFAFGALIAGFLVLAALDVMSPDDFIVRTNLSRPTAAACFDVGYNTSLSADAWPALVAGISKLNPDKRTLAANSLVSQWQAETSDDWRTWNWGRIKGRRAVAHDLRYLKSIAKPPAAQDSNSWGP